MKIGNVGDGVEESSRTQDVGILGEQGGAAKSEGSVRERCAEAMGSTRTR